jgi:hypothetical protein
MKNLLFLLLLALCSAEVSRAQSAVNAAEIIARINRNEPVSYQNAVISGDLDLTELANKRPNDRSNWGGQGSYLSTVTVPVTFKNCTFSGNVIAYKNTTASRNREDGLLNMGNGGITSTADFTEPVTFDNCVFQQDAAFKYTTFRRQAAFVGNTFKDIALFKYTRFSESAVFSGSSFGEYADFKYAKFNTESDFRNTRFNGSADFKYTKFDEKADFGQARFARNADFKYTDLPRGSRFDETEFNGSADFKYTTLGGKRFSPR